jgi:ketosteroid isomerase-like protein
MTHRFSPLIFNCLLFLLYINTSNAQAVSNADLSSVKKIIEEKNLQYFTAIEKNDVKAFEEQFLEDSWIMVPNAPIYCGPGAMADYFSEVGMKKGIARGKFIAIDLYGVGSEIVAEVGFYHFYDKSNQQFDDGKYIVLWKRVDGHWRRLRQTITSSRPNGI